ncbi:MAG: ComEC/Rec2 family competence protein [Planctomycetota bacterium]|nr:MAG: ComEC/Rec2 family competence protein [Planctomycetota bacterium]
MTPPAASPRARSAYQPLVSVLAAACTGIVLDRWLAWAAPLWWIAALAAWITWCVLWRRGRVRLAVVALLVSVAAVGAAWHHCRWSLFDRDHVVRLAPPNAGPAALEVLATSGPRRIPAPPPDPLRTIATPERTRLEVDVVGLRDRDLWRNASGHATIYCDGHVLDIEPGDRLRVFVQLGAIPGPDNPGEFDFAAQARGDRRLCWARCEFPECVSRVSERHTWSLHGLASALRRRGEALLWRKLPPEQSPLAVAMFLGSRQELEPEVTQAFVETGTIHLLVVSGLHVGILATCLFSVMRVAMVPRGWSLAIVMVACILYALATGAQPPVVRATVMVLAGCLALVLSRRALAFNTLAAAGLVVLAINPAELFQAGTQLSFLSVGALAFLAQVRLARPEPDPLARLIARTRPWPQRVMRQLGGGVMGTVLATTVIWLVICPLVMARFHLLSPVAVALGPLLALPMTVAMASGLGVLALGWLAPPLAVPLGIVCSYCLALMQTAVEAASRLSVGHLWVTGPAGWWLAGFYGLLAAWALVPRVRPRPQWCVGLVAAWVAIGLLASIARPHQSDQLKCTFLSVGHGTAVVLELPGGQTLLYDAGRLGSPQGASRAVAGYLWSRGITHLDAIVISHADADHYNAVPELLDQFSTGAVYVSPLMFFERSRALDALHEAIDASGVPLSEVWAGDHLDAGQAVQIEVLHPPRRGVLGSDNANSIVLAIEYAGRRLLLTGDVESPGLNDLLAELPYDTDVVMAPHHGSASSDPPGFAAWSTPEWAIVSGGRSDRLGPVEAAYTERGCRVLQTAKRGAITVSLSADEVAIESWRD